jgi:hypothetical protein
MFSVEEKKPLVWPPSWGAGKENSQNSPLEEETRHVKREEY